MGLGDTSGTQSLLVDGADISLGGGTEKVASLDLVQETIAITGKPLQAGEILISLSGNDPNVGSGAPIAVTRHDVFKLHVSQTGADTTATATMFFQGGDVGIDRGNESFWALATRINTASGNADPVLGLPGGPASYTENGLPMRIDATATVTDANSANFYAGQLRRGIDSGRHDGRSVGDPPRRHGGRTDWRVRRPGQLWRRHDRQLCRDTGAADPLLVTFNSMRHGGRRSGPGPERDFRQRVRRPRPAQPAPCDSC